MIMRRFWKLAQNLTLCVAAAGLMSFGNAEAQAGWGIKVSPPKVSVPVSAPNLNIPPVNTPKVDVPKASLPKAKAPKVTVPKTSPSKFPVKMKAPKVHVSKKLESKGGLPKSLLPKNKRPKLSVPKMDASKVTGKKLRLPVHPLTTRPTKVHVPKAKLPTTLTKPTVLKMPKNPISKTASTSLPKVKKAMPRISKDDVVREGKKAGGVAGKVGQAIGKTISRGKQVPSAGGGHKVLAAPDETGKGTGAPDDDEDEPANTPVQVTGGY
jgi:hypothetical protein